MSEREFCHHGAEVNEGGSSILLSPEPEVLSVLLPSVILQMRVLQTQFVQVIMQKTFEVAERLFQERERSAVFTRSDRRPFRERGSVEISPS